jgi:hypothetical protein
MAVFLASDELRFISDQKYLIDNTASIALGIVPADKP